MNNNVVKLSSDYGERSIRSEISYQLRFLIKEMSTDFIIEHLVDIV